MDRVKELDGLRGVAAVVILGFHLRPGGAFPMGWAAVDVFFVLSGYLITSIILRHDATWSFLKAFCLRRGLRIWPPYYLALTALVLIDYTLGDRLPLAYLPSFLTFTQGLPWLAGPGVQAPSYFGHTWTLAMEEQFYLVWPALVFLLGRRWVGPLSALVVMLAVYGRASGFPPHLLALRCDGFATGSLLASLLANPAQVARFAGVFRGAFASVGLGLLAYVLLAEMGPSVGLFHVGGSPRFVLNLLFACLVGLIVLSKDAGWLRPLRSRLLVHLGQISYGLYLYHSLTFFLVFVLAKCLGYSHSLGLDAMAFVATWVVALASWRLMERPLLRLKERFPYTSEPETLEDGLARVRSTQRGHKAKRQSHLATSASRPS